MRDLRSICFAVPALLAGCGGVEATPADANLVDAAPLPPDAVVAGDVTLTVADPYDDAVAVFLDAAGVTVDVVPLAPSGVATRSMLPGGSVGLVLDARGRHPLPVPTERSARVAAAKRWSDALDMYPAS